MKKIKEEQLYNIAELYKVFGDSTRLRILYSLFESDGKNVSQIANELSMNQSAISHQLKILKTNKLIKSNRQGKEIYYSLNDSHVYNIISQAIEHIEEK